MVHFKAVDEAQKQSIVHAVLHIRLHKIEVFDPLPAGRIPAYSSFFSVINKRFDMGFFIFGDSEYEREYKHHSSKYLSSWIIKV